MMRSMSGLGDAGGGGGGGRLVRPINLNVLPVWTSGLTGRGVVVTILDDGIYYIQLYIAQYLRGKYSSGAVGT